jgi:hypothetical protein
MIINKKKCIGRQLNKIKGEKKLSRATKKIMPPKKKDEILSVN